MGPLCSASLSGTGRPKANVTDFQWLDRDLDLGEIGAETTGAAGPGRCPKFPLVDEKRGL